MDGPKEPRGAEASFELVRRAGAGDRDAENEICRRYIPRLHRWARGRVPDGLRPAVETADVVQEVLILALRSFPRFEQRHSHSFPAFLRTVLNNKLLDMHRLSRRRPAPGPLDPELGIPSAEESPFERAAGVEQHERVDAALKQLSAVDQTLYFLRMELDCEYDEMAGMLGRSNPNAVRVASRRAVERLAKVLAQTAPP